jgi:acyl-CoA synthetase (AMP-forming)/AMP-acid ligase II
MPSIDLHTLWASLSESRYSTGRMLWGAETNVCLDDLKRASSVSGGPEQLRGRSVVLAMRDQLTAALALIELDGIARRLTLCPPDMLDALIPFIVEGVAADVILTDGSVPAGTQSSERVVVCSPNLQPSVADRSGTLQTEWILLTSGTTGLPKLVMHTLSTLSGAITDCVKTSSVVVWSTFYDIRRYGGLQIFLRAMLGGGSLVLSSAHERIGEVLVRLGKHGATHISGTPSHWRRALMSPSAGAIAPRYVRLSGEIADQPILDRLRNFYPAASVAHAFASTEAGVAFDVPDGLAGFPASLVGCRGPVEMKVVAGSLRIRSARTAICYLGAERLPIGDVQGFVDTGDLLELQRDRYFFVGRRDGVINVGGLKVYPEEVEAVINGHPSVQISRVKAQKSPLTGTIVAADVVAKPELSRGDPNNGLEVLRDEIVEVCHRGLASYKVPAIIHFVPFLSVAPSGKLTRRGA